MGSGPSPTLLRMEMEGREWEILRKMGGKGEGSNIQTKGSCKPLGEEILGKEEGHG